MSHDWAGKHQEVEVARFQSFSGGKDSPISNGEKFQCDCTAPGCSCTDWGHWVAAGKPIPNEVRCTDCNAGRHK